ncbi:DUF2642 domain-containing protein [Virgibacillus alimentarius]|uniref:DUF2642 domain-containing protein n=1 Tax=Virgibacillus alimentarius TaxID=698769 RepID=A0ABS4SAX7_9BACI|nr:DUF2642 domain-containing protein [Virgibacillus alimentarius]MBP2258645.1 hypothetical protein [Virgibacillus alimentarius]
MARTERQRRLMNLMNQMSQNFMANRYNADFSIDFPEVDLGGIQTGHSAPDTPGPGTPPGTPETMRELLLTLVNEQVEITTPFGIVSGTLIAVRDDYIVVIEDTGAQALVRIENIELVSEA